MNWAVNGVYWAIMGLDRINAGDMSCLKLNTFESKWAVVLPGQFAGTFAGPDTYWLSFILVVNSFDSSLVCTRLNCWHRSPPSSSVFY